MIDCFDDAWRRLLTLSPSYWRTTGSLQVVCLDLLQRMAKSPGVHARTVFALLDTYYQNCSDEVSTQH